VQSDPIFLCGRKRKSWLQDLHDDSHDEQDLYVNLVHHVILLAVDVT
jgi:hypothetical protein